MPSEPRDPQSVTDWPQLAAKQVAFVIRLPRFVREEPFRVIVTDVQPGLDGRKHAGCDRYPPLTGWRLRSRLYVATIDIPSHVEELGFQVEVAHLKPQNFADP